MAAHMRPPGQHQAPEINVDFDALYRSQWWSMLRIAQGLVDDPTTAEDVVQDAFAALYSRLPHLRDAQAAVGYLRVSVVNGGRSTLRRRRTLRSHIPDRELHQSAADDRIEQAANRDAVLDVLAALPQRQREVLTLRLVADLSDNEIAAAVGTSPGNVRVAASRGLSTLRRALGGQP